MALEEARRKAVEAGARDIPDGVMSVMALLKDEDAVRNTGIASVVVAVKPGDGSAREQAASSQRVLGGQANIAEEYATKRYRSNLINWGMIPFITDPADRAKLKVGSWVYVPGIRDALEKGLESVAARVFDAANAEDITLKMPDLTPEDREIILAGCLMNYYAKQNAQ